MRLRMAASIAALLAAVGLLTTACTTSRHPAPVASPTSSSTSYAVTSPIDLPANPRVYFFGDSWTHGASAAEGRGFPHVAGEALGWSVQVGPDESGAGYVNIYDARHPVFPEAVASLGPVDADLIIVEGGLNDEPGPLDRFWSAAQRTVEELRTASDGAPIVLVGPSTWDGHPSDALGAIDSAEAGVAAALGLHYISPLQQRWFTTANIPDLFDPVTHHPNTAGHAYYGGRLASALAEFTRTPH